ncbi:hypothetical protein BC835DRAFT_1413005 [Cytidiella melzeri]|nr:hypothetical protein BC835DRAFT_1413005 [Cytidiella melzeri]
MSQDLSYLDVDDDDFVSREHSYDSDEELYDDTTQLLTGQMGSLSLGSRGNSRPAPSSASSRQASRSSASRRTDEDVMEALTRAQLKYVDMQEQLRQSEQDRQKLSDNLRMAKRRGGKGRSKEPAEDNDPATALVNLRVKKVQDVARPIVDAASRYDSTDTQETAHKAEMWDVLAANPDVKPVLGIAEWLPTKFREAVLEEKSKFVHAAMGNISDIFGSLGLSSDTLGRAASRKACEVLQALGPKNARDYYCNALYPDDRPGQIAWLFRTNRIVFVIKSGILGRGSIKGSTNTLTKAHLWGITTVTPGLIAFAAVVLIYLISGDDSFAVANTLKATSYNYQSLFDRYVKLLITSPRTTEPLLQWMNREVFGKDSAGLSDTDLAEPDEDIDAHNEEVEAMFGEVNIEPLSRGPSPPPAAAPRRASRGPSPPPAAAPRRASRALPSPPADPVPAPPRSQSLAPPAPRSVSTRVRSPSSSAPPRDTEPVGGVVRPAAPRILPPSGAPSPVAPAFPPAPPGLGPPPQAAGSNTQRTSVIVAGVGSLDQRPLATNERKRGKKNTATHPTDAAEVQEPIVTRRSTRHKP